MAQPRSAKTLLDLFAVETVVNLPRIQVALGGVSSMTAFRYLKQMSYWRSYIAREVDPRPDLPQLFPIFS